MYLAERLAVTPSQRRLFFCKRCNKAPGFVTIHVDNGEGLAFVNCHGEIEELNLTDNTIFPMEVFNDKTN